MEAKKGRRIKDRQSLLLRNKKRRTVQTTLPSQPTINEITKILGKQIDKEIFLKKYARVADVLLLVGMGVFLGASLVIPNLPKALLPLFKPNEKEAWRRFNVPYLKRTLKRLEDEKLVEVDEENGLQVVKITEAGKIKILKCALDKLKIEKPKIWDRTWWLVSYDISRDFEHKRDIFRDYLKTWGFYPLQESVFLHAYPCLKQIEFLREYLGVGDCVRLFRVSQIENDRLFREFFGV
ncbi:MAG: hypothetical protein ACOZBZ_01365 [Patescibacteria group bacterium]